MFIEVPSHKSERICRCVLRVSVSPMFLLDSETIATVCYLLYFILLYNQITLRAVQKNYS